LRDGKKLALQRKKKQMKISALYQKDCQDKHLWTFILAMPDFVCMQNVVELAAQDGKLVVRRDFENLSKVVETYRTDIP